VARLLRSRRDDLDADDVDRVAAEVTLTVVQVFDERLDAADRPAG
jgi:hypothetical protein